MKRGLDFWLALVAAVPAGILFAFLWLLVRLKIGEPVLFRQERPGLNGKPFTLFKFRTMSDTRDESGHLLPDEKRLSSFGNFLRSTSLDELPELWNILRGDMSFVGPRPLLTEYLDRYNVRQARRHEVRPGLTGWAQVNGRNSLSWEERLEMDVWYVENRSMWLDLRILLKTVAVVFQRKGISAEGHVTMEKFQGSGSTVGKNGSTNDTNEHKSLKGPE